MALKIERVAYEEAKMLSQEGDIDPRRMRAIYEKKAQKPTTLNDDQLAVAAMASDDDDDEYYDRMVQIEREGYEITDQPNAA